MEMLLPNGVMGRKKKKKRKKAIDSTLARESDASLPVASVSRVEFVLTDARLSPEWNPGAAVDHRSDSASPNFVQCTFTVHVVYCYCLELSNSSQNS